MAMDVLRYPGVVAEVPEERDAACVDRRTAVRTCGGEGHTLALRIVRWQRRKCVLTRGHWLRHRGPQHFEIVGGIDPIPLIVKALLKIPEDAVQFADRFVCAHWRKLCETHVR